MSTVYIFDKSLKYIEKKKMISSLSTESLKAVSKYPIEEDYINSLTGWYLLKNFLEEDYKIKLNDYEIQFNQYGKPYIEENIHFNISHSNNFIVIIISKSNCGIDVEMINNRQLSKRLVNKILSSNEKREIKNDEDLIKLWTRKEAYLKKEGTGILLSKLSDNIDYSSVKTLKLKDSKNNEYFLSYISEDDSYSIKIK